MPRKPLILTGKKIGRLLLLEEIKPVNSSRRYRCLCDCGAEKIIAHSSIHHGHTKSCGCLNKEECKKRVYRHGKADDKTHKTWTEMRQRCNNPNNRAYKNYGGRGITVCERWNDFSLFLKDMGERPEGLSLDRINNDGNYSPENCRWSTFKEQNNNRRSNTLITFQGRTQNITQWAEEIGIIPATLMTRLSVGWSIEKALTTPKLGTKT